MSKDDAELRGEPFADLIFGRVLADDVADAKGNVIIHKDTLIDKATLQLILDANIEYVKLRSPLTCETVGGVCQHCFGMDMSTRQRVDIGIPVGIISSQSIGEPGTQLTMRTFHT